MGYASALAWLLFIVTMAITLLILRLSRRLVYYEVK
jgi:multiple sugar transport system permease protein